jgi:mannose-6-phosphate isomerase-like protein (cupin superfamily)
MKVSIDDARKKLDDSKNLFLELFTHGTLSLEVYRPQQRDRQTPHDRDEIYVITSGSGEFYCDGETTSFKAGDFLFVPAGIEHRFVNFSDDFVTWVMFYGPKGGEGKK